MKIVVGKDMATFTLMEKTRREKHIPTEKEQELYNRQQAKRPRAADYQNWDSVQVASLQGTLARI